jgi:hypothetical protein
MISIDMPGIVLSEAQRLRLTSIARSYKISLVVSDSKHQREGEVFPPSA